MANEFSTRDKQNNLGIGTEVFQKALGVRGKYGLVMYAYKQGVISLAEYSSAVGSRGGIMILTAYGEELYQKLLDEHRPLFIAHAARKKIGVPDGSE